MQEQCRFRTEERIEGRYRVVCRVCGRRLTAPNPPEKIHALCDVQEPCQHRGPEKDGLTVKCGCGNAQEKSHAVHVCEIHNRCLPTFRGPFDEDHKLEAELYTLCHTCPDYKP